MADEHEAAKPTTRGRRRCQPLDGPDLCKAFAAPTSVCVGRCAAVVAHEMPSRLHEMPSSTRWHRKLRAAD